MAKAYTNTEAEARKRDLIGRIRATKYGTPEYASLKTELDANRAARVATVRDEAAQDSIIRKQARDPGGMGAAYKPPDILDPNYIAAIKAASDATMAATTRPGLFERAQAKAAPIQEARTASRLGVDVGEARRMTGLRDTPSAAIGAMDNRDFARADLAKRVAAIQGERPAYEAGDRAFNSVIDKAPPVGEPVIEDANAVRSGVINGLLARMKAPPAPPPSFPESAPGDTPENRDALAQYVQRRDTAMRPVLAGRAAAENVASQDIMAKADQKRLDEEGRAREMRDLQKRLALAGVVGAEREAGIISPEVPVDPTEKAAKDEAAFVAGLSAAGYDPESASARIAKFASDLGSFAPNYPAIAASIDEWLSTLPPDAQREAAKRIEAQIVTQGSRKRTLLGRVIGANSPGVDVGKIVNMAQRRVDSVLQKYKGG